MAAYKVKYEKKNGNVTTTQVSANSEQEAKQKALMSSDVKKVIAVVKA
ncbi:MAG: hypothetical protein K2N58_08050 [Treponemataceae bacterium]|nr:hypothetical protein [Treponemataceae bacterium]